MNPSDEPALIAGAVGAVLTLLIAFGAPISVDQKAAVLGVVAPVYALASALWVRSKSTPNTKVGQ